MKRYEISYTGSVLEVVKDECHMLNSVFCVCVSISS